MTPAQARPRCTVCGRYVARDRYGMPRHWLGDLHPFCPEDYIEALAEMRAAGRIGP